MPGRTDAAALGRAFLARARNRDGSFGYRAGAGGRAEPTVLAAAAGAGLASGWLAQAELGWAALLLPAVAWDLDRALCEPIVAAIEVEHSESIEGVPWYDATIPGWSWVPGTAAWVEPTAYAILSLLRAGRGADRVAQGRALLIDRQSADGGWNIGNPRVYDQELEGKPAFTGWATLAMPPGDPADRGLRFLEQTLAEPSTLGLALAAMAHVAHGRDAAPFAAALAPRVGADGVRGRVDLTSMAVMALDAVESGRHALQ